MKTLLPIAVLIVGVIVFQLVNILGHTETTTEPPDLRPRVAVEQVVPQNHQVLIRGFGSIEPLEQISLSAQVSGEVESWHPEFIEGGIVKRGERLFSIEKTAYQAAYLQAEANLASAKATLTEQQALAKVAEDEARANPQKRYTDLFLRKPQVISAQSAVKSAQAALTIAERDLKNCDIFAPFDALVVASNIGVGQYLTTGNPIATLYNIETAKVVVPIPGFEAQFLPASFAGAETRIRIPGSQTAGRTGKVRHTIGVVDEATRMTQIFVEINDPFALKGNEQALKFGDYVEAEFPGKLLKGVYTLPQELVNTSGVWLLDDNSRLSETKVEVLRREGDRFIVGGGLNENDWVVTTLPEFPSQGMLVKVLEREQELDSMQPSASQQELR